MRVSPQQRAATVSLAATLVVVTVKAVAAAASGSLSVLAEALQSSVDILASGLVVWSVRLAARPPDREHPYGHGKAEALVATVQMLLVLLSAGVVLLLAYQRFLAPSPIAVDSGIVGMGYALISNTAVSIYLGRVARRTGSPALQAEMIHLRGDSLSSAGVLAGLVAVAVTGISWLDPLIACALMAVVIVSAVRQLGRLFHPLMDGSLPEDEVQAIERLLEEDPSVRGYHNLRTRRSGARRMIEIHVMLDDDLTFVEAHEHAERIEDRLRARWPETEVNLHYEPYEAEMRHQSEAHSGKEISRGES